jgi:protein subunit release factor A
VGSQSIQAKAGLTTQAGDRVQWFRAEAEMNRWREEYEVRLADLLRCIRYFKRMEEVWLELAATSAKHGHAIYARTVANMYQRMAADAQTNLEVVIPQGIKLNSGEILADYVQEMRDKEDTECELNSIFAQVYQTLNQFLLDADEFPLED